MTDLHDKARELLEGPKRYPSDTGRTVYTPVFMKHLAAMTQEGLHDKGNIAEQLAYRDQIIAGLLAENERLTNALAERQAHWRDAVGEVEQMKAAVVERDRLLAAEDRSHTDTIIKRDYAEEVIDKLCDAVLGVAPEHRPEWSNAYGFCDAVEAVEERMARAEAAEARLKALCEAEPLMLLHTGKIYDDGEQDDWDSEADSGKRIDAYCRKHPGQTTPLIPRPSMEGKP